MWLTHNNTVKLIIISSNGKESYVSKCSYGESTNTHANTMSFIHTLVNKYKQRYGMQTDYLYATE